ncbi:MAG: hypothetical protein H0T73_15295, partial [Ardenticatenales bacterium]|nr:hypothetical protein [Ardenticatenales bacterium]
YVDVVNRSFLNTGSATPEQAQAAAAEAFNQYQQVQTELESYLAETNLPQLKREAQGARAVLEILQEQRVIALSLVNTAALSLTSELADTTTTAMVDQVAYSVKRASTDQIRLLDYWYERRATLTRSQGILSDLENQLRGGQVTGGAISGDFLALLLTQAGLFEAGNNEVAPQLQFDLSNLNALGQDVTLEDITVLRESVSAGISEAAGEIQRLSEEVFLGAGLNSPTTVPDEHALMALIKSQTKAVLNTELLLSPDSEELQNSPLSQNIALLSTRLQQLQSDIERLSAREKELLRARDVAWDLYTTLDNKAQEAAAQFATGSPQARLALAATVPTFANAQGRTAFSLFAAMAGAIAMTLLVIGREAWRRFSSTRPAALPMRPTREESPWSAFEPLPQGVIILNPDKSLLYLNPSVRHLLHLGDGMLVGRPIRALKQAELADAVAALTLDGATVYREAILGQERRVLIGAMAAPLRHARNGSETPHWIVVLQDISGSLNQRMDLTPLLADLAAHIPASQAALPPTRHDPFVTAPHTEVRQVEELRDEMGSVVGKLAFLEQAEAGIGERRTVHLKRLVQRVVDELMPVAVSRNIDIKEELPLTLPPLMANSEQLHQAIKHLVDNAVKYSPDHTKVRLRAKLEEDSLILAVLDSGIGIWVKDIPFLFDRYYRVQIPEVLAVPGHGLGLATVKAVAEAHGGRAWAESRPGSGSIFFIKFPLTPAQHRTPATFGNGNGSTH